MSGWFIQYAVNLFFCAMSVRDFLRENWHGAFYFLLAAGFLALWTELRRGGGAVYNNCSWFVNPPPMPTDETGKENPPDDGHGK